MVTRTHSLTVGLILSALALSTIVGAQSPASPADQNIIRIRSGETIEIGMDSAHPETEFSWVLTKDRQFQMADRKRFFQTRLKEPGTYVLDVSVQDPSTSTSGYQAFTIVVSEETVPAPALRDETKPLKAVLTTDPPLQNGSVFLPSQGGVIKLDPGLSEGRIASFDIDADSTVDSSGDGNPTNDKDTQGTFSQKSGTPIYLFAFPRQNRTALLTVSGLSADPAQTASVNFVFGGTPPPSSIGSSTSAGTISSAASSAASTPFGGSSSSPQFPPAPTGTVVIEKDGATVRFSFGADAPQTAGKELLLSWDFGDRSRSLLAFPEHTYRTPGTYTVTVTAYDITTGQPLLTGSVPVEITFEPIPGTTSSESSVASVASSEPSGGGQSGFNLWSIVKVGGIILFLLLLMVGMYVLVIWLKRMVAGRLSGAFEKMEQTIVKKEDEKTAPGEAAIQPMQLKKSSSPPPAPSPSRAQAVSDRELSKDEFRSRERTLETPAVSAGPVPSWLASAKPSGEAGLSAKPSATTEAPAPTSTPPKPETAPSASVPDWLKPKADSEAPKSPAPAAPLAPAKPAEAVPDWLKGAPPQSVATDDTPVSKSPEPPKPAATPKAPEPAPAPPAVPSKPGEPPKASQAAAPVPDWLKPKAPASSAATPAPMKEEVKEPVAPKAPDIPVPPKPEATPETNTPAEPTKTEAEKPKTPPTETKTEKQEGSDEPPIALVKADNIGT